MRGLLWLVGAVLLLGSIDGGDTYEQLDDKTRDIVDQAIINAMEKYGQNTHIDFHSIICSDNSRLFHVKLVPTSCAKGASIHRRECTFQRKPKFMISCVACDNDVTCGRTNKDREMINDLIKKCGSECRPRSQYLNGGGDPMSLKVEGKEYGCLGCI